MAIQEGAIWWNNGEINKRSVDCPGEGFVKGRKSFKRKPHSDEHRKKLSKALKGKAAWNKGLVDSVSEETRNKMSDSAKARSKRGIMPDNTGNTAWNKGLTKETDERVKKYANTQYGQLRIGNYITGKDHPNWNDSKSEYQEYSYKVMRLSEHNYKNNKSIINPEGLPRGKCGVDGVYQLDHIIPIHYGFINNIPVEIIADTSNLQMLSWESNRIKSNNVVACLTELMANVDWK
jgi:hypothetical protein